MKVEIVRSRRFKEARPGPPDGYLYHPRRLSHSRACRYLLVAIAAGGFDC